MLPTLELFGLPIPMFGTMMACGMIAAILLLMYTRRFIPFTEDQLLTSALWAVALGFLGSKVLFWIVELDHVLANPHFLIETLRTGFVFYGALLGGMIGIFIYCVRSKLPMLAFFDLFAPSLVLAQAFGRIGCFLAGCCYGCESDAWCAVVYPPGSGAPSGVPLLPVQLFESAFLVILALVLVELLRKRKTYGLVTGWYFVLYGIWRFIIEFFRSDDRGFVGGLSTSQFIGLFIVLAGAVLLWLIHKGIVSRETLDVPEAAPVKHEAAQGPSPDAKQNDKTKTPS